MAPPRFAARVARSSFQSAIFIVFALAVVLFGCWLLYQREANQISQRQAEREVVRVNLLAKLLQSELRPVADDLRLLADGDGLRAYLETGHPEGLQRAIRRAKFFSEHKPAYDQIRYLDESGQEVLRVNQGGQVVQPGELQNKADRGYFREAIRLPPGGLYLSAMDLNIEHGRIEQPLKPMLRFAAPVFDSAGRQRGAYVINYEAGGLITRLQQTIPQYAHRLRLLNADGYWLKAADPALEWGFMLPERSQLTLARSDPSLWAQILREPFGQLRNESHLFTWRRLEPAEFSGVSEGGLKTGDRFLVMASEFSPSEWAALFTGLRQIMVILTGAMVLLTFTSLWLFRRWRQAMRSLRETNDQLERRVRERTAELAESNAMLRDREQLLEETGNLAKVGGWDFDPATGTGRWTAEVARIHDLDPSIEPSKGMGLQFYPGESRTRLEQAIERSLAGGTPYDLELEFLSARGVAKWVRTICRPQMEHGKVVRMRGAFQDVTDRKLIELKLQSQLQRLHLLEQITRSIGERQNLTSVFEVTIRVLESELPLDFGCIGLYDVGKRTLSIAAVGSGSEALASTMDMAVGAIIPIDENGLSRCVRGHLVHEPDIAGLPFPFPKRLASGGLRALVIAPLQVESQVFGVLVAARRQPQSFSSGECEFLKQLSEHIALAAHQAQLHGALQVAYEDLRNTQQAVMQQERLKVLGQMASGIAHDINNAISPVMLYTDSLLEREPGLSDRARASLKTIQQAVSDVAETVTRMREFYRQRAPQNELRPVQLNELVQQVVELTRARWEAMPQQRGIVIQLHTNFAARLPAALGIESEIREALTNLIFNAVDAMPQGGTLTLRTRQDEEGRVLVEVTDSGMGMDEDTRRRCLEPFFTTKGERGTGLGLAMVYGVMQRHSGAIEIDSAPGAGTTVRLAFTMGKSATTSTTNARLEVPPNLTILLIDDDPTVLKSLRETLELDGHTILIANGGRQGVDLFRASQRGEVNGKVSAVITDLGMPHVDGRSVAAAIKADSPATPVILLTGWGERLLAEGTVPVNVDRVLSKPPRLKAVREALSELVTPGDQGNPSP